VIVRILGSAAGGGVPQWNCGCANCARARDGSAPLRTQSSIAVSPDGSDWLIVNVSTDFPQQCARTPELWPSTARATPFRAILFTDANVDHTAGLIELRQDPDPVTIVSTPIVRSLLARERAYERFDAPPHRWIAREAGGDLAAEIDPALAQRVEIEAIEVAGLLPGYAGRRPARGAVVAYRLRSRRGKQVLIAPVFAELDDALLALVEASDAAFLDGSFFSDDELIAGGLMEKSARALGHAPIGGESGTLARIARLRNRRVYMHVNNSNPILDEGSEASALLKAAGCEVGFDGMTVEL
jgi:pyrroloquinoline quinone biosynthesis protein B